MGYDETDRASVIRYLGSLGCRTEGALLVAARHQQPLTLELARLLIDAGAFDKDALSYAARYQQPLTLELAKVLIDAGAFDKDVLWIAAEYQQPLITELAKLLIDAGYDPTTRDDCGWDALVWLAWNDRPVDPQVTDLFLSAGCRTDLDGCTGIFDEQRTRFDQILKEHAEWKRRQECAVAENDPATSPCGLDWRT